MSGLLSREFIEQLRSTAAIEEVAARYTSLRRIGDEMRGLCPLHEEKTPSFSVNPPKSVFHCFGCGASGDVFRLVMLVEGLNFAEAARRVGELSGVKVKGARIMPSAKVARLRAEYAHKRRKHNRMERFGRWQARKFRLAIRGRIEVDLRAHWLQLCIARGYLTDMEADSAGRELCALDVRAGVNAETLRILTEGSTAERIALFKNKMQSDVE